MVVGDSVASSCWINPSDVSFGVAVITPRWLYVIAAATGVRWGDPNVVDETLDPIDPVDVSPGDVVGIGIHTGNALRGYSIGQMARAIDPVGALARTAYAAAVPDDSDASPPGAGTQARSSSHTRDNRPV